MNPAHAVSTLEPPPGPRGLPVLGSLHRLRGADPLHVAITRISRQYGDIASIRLGSLPTVLLAHPDAMREAFGKDELSERRIMVAHSNLSAVPGLIYSSYTRRWHDLNRFARQELFGGANVTALSRDHFGPMIDEAVESIALMADAGAPAPVHELLISSAFDLIFRTLFGQGCAETGERRRMKDELLESLRRIEAAAIARGYNLMDAIPASKLLLGGLLRESRLEREKRDGIVGRCVDHVEMCRGDGPPACLVDKMLEKEASGEFDRPVTLALCMDVLVNASSFATVAGWALLLAANRPDVQARIHEELDRVIGRDGPSPTEADRQRLPYTFACIAESMRYRPVSPLSLPHLATVDTEIGGYRVAAGTQVIGNFYAVHHDERFWESPGEFTPERFLPRSDRLASAGMSNPAYMPFGIGIRNCAGDRFAIGAIWLYVVRILHTFLLEPPAGVPLPEEEVFGLFVSPQPHALKATRRGRK